MKKNILEIYALVVCFSAVMVILFTTGEAGWNVVKIINPTLTIGSHDYNRHQSNEEFGKSLRSNDEEEGDKKVAPKPLPSEEKLTQMRNESWGRELTGEKREGLRDFIKNLITLCIASLLFLLHWFLAKRARRGTD